MNVWRRFARLAAPLHQSQSRISKASSVCRAEPVHPLRHLHQIAGGSAHSWHYRPATGLEAAQLLPQNPPPPPPQANNPTGSAAGARLLHICFRALRLSCCQRASFLHCCSSDCTYYNNYYHKHSTLFLFCEPLQILLLSCQCTRIDAGFNQRIRSTSWLNFLPKFNEKMDFTLVSVS